MPAPVQTPRLGSPLFQAVARDLLRAGTAVSFEASGLSMLPEIQDGDVLHVAPVVASALRRHEIVLTEDNGQLRAHRLIVADVRGDRFVTQGDASQEPDAPVRAHQILGRVVAKEVKPKESTMNGIGGQDNGQRVELHGMRAQARRRMTQARNVAADWVKTALGISSPARAGVTLSLLLLCLAAVPASAQVVVDSSSKGGGQITTGGNITFIHTAGAGTGRTLVVGVALNITNNTAAKVTSVTYGAQTLTFLSAQTDGTTRRVEFWFLLAPAVGANNITVTANAFGAGTIGMAAVSQTFTGADQTDPVRPTVGNNGTTATGASVLTLDVPSALKEVVFAVDAVGGDYTQALPAVGFGGITLKQQGTTSGAPTTATDVDIAGYTVAGAPSVPIPLVLARAFGAAANTNWSAEGVSIHPLNADMGVTVTTNGAIYTGGTVIYTVTLKNNGWSDAASVVLTFPLAAGETFVSATAPCTQAAGTVTCNEGTIASAASVTETIKATIATAGNYTTTATLSSSTTDLNSSNNTFISTVPVQTAVCATPGKDGTPGAAITSVVNTYYPGTASAASGTTSITLGASTGAGTAIAIGDLLLVMQMQDAAINTTNGSTYGDGSGAGSGSTNLNASGRYEYVKANSAVPAGGGTATIVGAGSGGGLIYSYTNAAATNTQGQRRFQVIRVPQYVAATVGAALTASAWDGTTGGVLAIDVQNTLTLASQTIDVSGLGFRGGAGLQLNGVTAGSSNTDFQFAAPAAYAAPTNGWHGIKGEGIAGTPAYVQSGGTFLATGSNYPSGTAADGSMGRGAPGNAGGGGTDAESGAGNSNNSGGGGGGNGGIGGAGGNSQAVDLASGGIPGAAFPNSINRLVMGGGGGAGGRNNVLTPTASAGGAGGGIVMIRAGFLSGTSTISANGLNPGDVTPNEGGGGGGAGGAVMVLSEAGGENGLTINVNGGKGGNANTATAFATFTSGVHGPGGGGGGGMIVSSGGLAASNRSGGNFGTTENVAFEWGATAGATGATPINSAKLSQVAGVRAGVECAAPDCVIDKTHVGNWIHGSTGNIYTITVSNASPFAPIVLGNIVTVVDTLPTGLTATAISGTGWTCILATLTCTRADALAALASYPPILVTVTVAANPPSNLLTNTATVSGGGEVQTNNDVATDPTNIVGTALTISKTANAVSYRPGNTMIYTITVGNSGPNDGGTASMTDPLPVANETFVSATDTFAGGATGTACTFATPTVTCNYTAFPVGASSVITVTVTAGTPATVKNTATLADTGVPAFVDTVTSSVTTVTTFPTSVALKSFTAQRTGSGTLLTWQTGGERHNLGFNVYREENGARVKVNPTLIAGSALRMRESLDQHSAFSYGWPDTKIDAKSGSAYWLEDVDLNGARTMHGPVYAESSASASTSSTATATRSATMAEVSVASAQPVAVSDSAAGPVFDASRAVPHFAAAQAVTAQQKQTQFGLAAGAAVKLSLRTEGWYRVSQKQLVAAGLNPSVDPKFLRLYTEGLEQPIRITGATSGPGGFGANAAIEFYATGIDTPFSDARVGWLVAGTTPGLRVVEAGNSGGNAGATSFPYAVELRQRTTYFGALLNGEDNDNFFGAIVTSAPVDQILTTHDVANANAAGATLEVAIQGGTTGITHLVNVNLNGTPLGAVNFTDQQLGTATLEIPAGTLLEGNNTVTLAAQNGDSDVSVVDHLTVHYLHSYVAESDALRFTAAAGDHVQIKGFATKPSRLVDITDAAQPVNLQLKVTGTAGNYALDVNVPWAATGTHTLMALAWNNLATAAAVKNQPSIWHTAQPGSDIVMITNTKFASSLQPLVKLRQSEGKTVSVVNVDDLYDEFNFGERSPYAVRNFLASATANWTKHPQYLLLVGDASLDPLNYLGTGSNDYVPTRIVETFYLKTASDEWFSDFTNTGIGQIATGRLPVRTVTDAQTVVRKITGHAQATGPWSKQTLLVADVDGGLTFGADTQSVKNLLPSTVAANVADANTLGLPATRAQILSQVNSGQLLVNYMGHGSVDGWSGGLLSSTDAAAFTNSNRLPVFLIMDCLNGYFQDVYSTSMAESLLLAPNGGAVAVWSSSGLTDAAPQAELDKQAVGNMFSAQNPALGDAIRAAKAKVNDFDVRRTYILFGDPSMKLQK
jgi:uncharacterized repeat protein (TIGR01451 family)